MSETPVPTKEMIDELRKVVSDYTPGITTKLYPVEVTCPDRLFIGLFGKIGCGKTSLINSLKFSARGRLRQSEWYQAAGQEKIGGHSMHRTLASITNNIFVIDNRGGDLNTIEAIEEVNAQLDGKRGYAEKVEWQKVKTSNDDNVLDEIEVDVNIGDPIGCAVFVFNARHYIDKSTNEVDMTGVIQLRDVIAAIQRQQGRYPVAVITHVDVAEKKAIDNLKAILRASGVSEIFDVANLTKEKQKLEERYQHVLLSMLERCMTDGDETLLFKHYRRQDEKRKEEIKKKQEEKRRKQQNDLKDAEIKKAVEAERRLQEAIRKAEAEMRQRLDDMQEEQRRKKICVIM